MNKFYVFFVITLICTLPVHHAHALSVKVSGNTGNAGVEGYLNGNSDVWELTTTLTNLEYPPVPDQVFLQIGTASTPFTSCSGDGTSAECKFISDLSDGIAEGSYDFKVAVYDAEQVNNETVISDTELGSDTENVYVDASKPVVSFIDARQDGQDVMLDFVAYDPNTCSGLKLLEVYNNDGGEVLDSITFDEPGVCEYDYETGNRAGELPAILGDQGSTELRVRATDWMGIQGVSNVQFFTRDFVEPSVDTVSFPGTESIGDREILVDVLLNVTECSGLTEVLVVSEQINFKGISGDVDYQGDCHYEVTWNDLSFTPTGETVTMTVVMQDQYVNIGEDIVTYTFDRDTTPPQVDFFGTAALFDDVSYMSDNAPTDIIAKITETGSGIDASQVIASFTALGRDYAAADYCLNESSSYTCVWEDLDSGSQEGTRAEEIRLVQVMDRAGNDYGTFTVPLIIDSIGPTVLDFDIESVSESGDSESFKSGDDVRIMLEVSEASGLVAKIDVHDLVMDADVKYDYGTDPYDDELPHEDNGYALFSNDQCERNDEGHWECEFVIENIRTGYVSDASMNILLYDTAGNIVEDWQSEPGNVDCDDGECGIEILAADYDTIPDLWEQGSVTSGGYVLLDTSDATYPRQDFSVSLYSPDGATLENYILQGCTAPDGSPAVARPVAFGGLGERTNARLSLIIELEPFDSSLITAGRTDEFIQDEREYNCSVLIQSSKNNVAYVNFEEQTIEVPVTFGFSSVGSMEEATDRLITEYMETKRFKTHKVFNQIGIVLQYAQRIYGSFKTFMGIVGLFNMFKATSSGTICKTEQTATLVGAGDPSCFKAVNYCDILSAGGSGLNGVLYTIDQFLGVFFCSAAPVQIQGNVFKEPDTIWKETYEATYDNQKAAMTAKKQQAAANRAANRQATEGQAESGRKGMKRGGQGQGWIDFMSFAKAWQTVVVTVWTLIRGQALTDSLVWLGSLGIKSDGAYNGSAQNFKNDAEYTAFMESDKTYQRVANQNQEYIERFTAASNSDNREERARVEAEYGNWLRQGADDGFEESMNEALNENQDRYGGVTYQQTNYASYDLFKAANTESSVSETQWNAARAHVNSALTQATGTNRAYLAEWNQYSNRMETKSALRSIASKGVTGSLYDNIYVSTIGLCIPGVVYNVQKLYMADCMYLSCLKNDVPAGLATVTSCTDTREYMYCKFVKGEVLGQITGVLGNILEGLMDLVMNFVTDPFSLIMIPASILCSQIGCKAISVDAGGLITFCNAMQVIQVGSGVVTHVQDWVNGVKSINVDFCDALIEEGVEAEVGETTVSETETETGTTGTTTVSEQ